MPLNSKARRARPHRSADRRRKIVVYIATSAGGCIARMNGSVDRLDTPRTAGDYGMSAFYRSIDTVIMGRRTYEMALRFGQTHHPGKMNYVFSRRRRRSGAGPVQFVRGGIGRFCRSLRSAPSSMPAGWTRSSSSSCRCSSQGRQGDRAGEPQRAGSSSRGAIRRAKASRSPRSSRIASKDLP
jgi:hypothetical protein